MPPGRYQEQDYLVREVDHYADKKYELILRWLGARPNAKVLNLGCGSGEMSVLLARRGCVVDAVDPSAAAVALAEERKRASGLSNIRIKRAGVFDLAPDTRYSAVVCVDVLEHIEDDRAAVRRIAEVVAPGGLLLLSVPALPWLYGYHDVQLGHYRRYSKGRLTSLLQEEFEVTEARYFGFSLIPVALLYGRLLKKPYPIRQSNATLARTLFAVEAALRPPLGTSLLVKARRGRASEADSPAPAAPCCSICRAEAIRVWHTVAGKPLYRCSGCGFAWFPPSAYSGESLLAQYRRDETSPATYYRAVEAYDLATFTARMKSIQNATRLQRGRILDVGCNVGTFLVAAANAGWSAVGVDPNPHAAGLVKERGFEVHNGFFDDALAAVLGEFDAVHLGDVVEHAFDPVTLMERARRVLKPGGLLMVVTPDLDSLLGRLLQIKPSEHLVYFTAPSLARAARMAGFTSIRVERQARRRSVRGLRWSTTFSPRGRALVRLLDVPGLREAVESALVRFFKDELLLTASSPSSAS